MARVSIMKVRPLLAKTLSSAAVLSTVALAQAQPKTCTVEAATFEIYGHVVDIEGRSASAMMPLIDELRALTAKAKDPSRSVGAQLSVHDSQRFMEIADQIKSVRLSNFIESGHSRDAIVVQQMFKAAWALYSNPSAFPADTDLPGNFLMVMRVAFPNVEAQAVATSFPACTVESALAIAEADAETRAINNPAIARDFPIVQQLKAKYGIGPSGVFDPTRLTPEDTRTLRRIQLAMQVAIQEEGLAKDIQNILDWWRMANLVYETRKEDVATYGPDIRVLGNTIEAQQNTFDDRNKAMLGLWAKVNEKIPSDEMKLLNAMAPAIDAAGTLDKRLLPAEKDSSSQIGH